MASCVGECLGSRLLDRRGSRLRLRLCFRSRRRGWFRLRLGFRLRSGCGRRLSDWRGFVINHRGRNGGC